MQHCNPCSSRYQLNTLNMIRQIAPGAGDFMPTWFFFSLQHALAEGYPDTSQLAKVD